MEDHCADCGSEMSAFTCPECGGIRSTKDWKRVSAMDLLNEAESMLNEGAAIIEVQEVELVALRREVDRLKVAAAERAP